MLRKEEEKRRWGNWAYLPLTWKINEGDQEGENGCLECLGEKMEHQPWCGCRASLVHAKGEEESLKKGRERRPRLRASHVTSK